jgi:hypothetical protein
MSLFHLGSARVTRAWLVMGTWLAVMHGCGGSASSPGPGAASDASQFEELCEAQCHRLARCEDATETSDAPCAACVATAPRPEVFRRDFVQTIIDCTERLACGDSDDGCVDEAIATVSADAASSTLAAKCLSVQDDCGDFSDDDCTYAFAFTDAARSDFDACLSQSCEDIGPCFAEFAGVDP